MTNNQEFRLRWERFKSALEDLDVKEYDSLQKYILLKGLNEFLNEIFDYVEEKSNKKIEMKMKKLTVEYQGYKLEVEITFSNEYSYPYIKGICNSISFAQMGYYGEYPYIIDKFMKVVDKEYKEEV